MSIFDELIDHAALPFPAARMMPSSAYTSDEVLAAEHRRIFADEWHCVGRTADLPDPGDYLVGEVPSSIPGEHRSVIVLRNDAGELAAFDNVCAHRGSPLLAGCGNEARITCPYHAWVFRLDGQLIGAPYMNATVDIDGQPFAPSTQSLRGVRLEVWEGFIFVNQSDDAPGLGERLIGLTERVAPFRMAGYVPVHQQVDVWATNWKLLFENFMDAYHVFKVHRASFAKNGDNTSATRMFPGTDDWAHHVVVHDSEHGSGSAHSDNTSLEGEWRRSVLLGAVFPTHVMQLQPDWLWSLQLSPIGTDHVRIRWDVSIAPEVFAAQADPSAYVAEVLELLNLVNAEDKPIVEGVRRGVTTPEMRRGPLSYLERNVYDFDRYITRRLTT